MDWILITFQWYFYLFIIGIIFLPLTTKIFSHFFDYGYAFSKTIAILALSYILFVLGTLRIAPFTATTIFIVIGILSLISIYFLRKDNFFQKLKKNYWIFFLEELIFLAGLFFLTFIRGQEPSIRGLEKFMDFGFINSILRSQYFPPLDIWLSGDNTHPNGYPINYYYFGHLTGAFLIKFTGISPFIGYNLILATILAQGMTLVFSLLGNCVAFIQKYVLKYNHLNYWSIILMGFLGSFIVNFAGNLHTVYLFTKGYVNESPIPFWEILSLNKLGEYWYPNATRFIPFTIHEFPAYSYVVADLHGHVFDIPFVLLTLSLLFTLFIYHYSSNNENKNQKRNILLMIVLLGFLTSIHYMTNAFDGPIYFLLSTIIIFVLFGFSIRSIIYTIILITAFFIFSLPFSYFFSPFVSGIGVNCSPEFLVAIKKLGPFIFEQGKCQASPPWMLFILWGFFWVSLAILTVILILQKKIKKSLFDLKQLSHIDLFMLILFTFSTFLIVIPEFFYIKDIYPAHFRANTMFKLGYQAFIIMGIASAFTFYRIKLLVKWLPIISLKFVYLFFFFFIFVYSFFAFQSYYGKLNKKPQLNGIMWLTKTYPEDKELIKYINQNIPNQPTILEAQGDSYTDYERVSAYTGLPTIAGWWVHEWLWRGSSDVIGKRIPDVAAIYESTDYELTRNLLKRYHVKYIVVSSLERNKYPNINEEKIRTISNRIFLSGNGRGALYQVK